MLWTQLFARKSLDTLLAEMHGDNRLRRALGPISLTSLGIGAIIGAGIFVITGRTAAQDAGPAVMVNPDHPAIRVAAKAFSDVLGKPTVFIRSGGSIPIVGDFAKHLGIPTVLMGFGLPDDGLHSPNEKYRVENFYQGIMTIAHFLDEYGAQSLSVGSASH